MMEVFFKRRQWKREEFSIKLKQLNEKGQVDETGEF